MPIDIDLHAIRPWRNSKNGGFEELCCQLASLEPPTPKATFVRKEGAGGDAGVECYWTLEDGSEYGWQVKYLPELGNSQWQQIDDSVKVALDKHPELIRYMVCLPIDLPDRRQKGQTSLKAKWDARVKKWSGWAAKKGMSVEFIYWGTHELGERLTRDDPHYSGRTLYWFNTKILTAEWFRQKFERARVNVGERYTPELNVELPIAKLFDGLARTPAFASEIQALRRAWHEAISVARRYLKEIDDEVALRALQADLDAAAGCLSTLLDNCLPDIVASFAIEELTKACDDTQEKLYACEEWLRASRSREDDPTLKKKTERLKDVRYAMSRFYGPLSDIKEFFQTHRVHATNSRAVVVLGEAGVGKSHLFCDVAASHTAKGWPALLFLGQQLSYGNPWDSFLSELDLGGQSVEQFLGALDAAAQAVGVRALILIDAINEGSGRELWKDRLLGFLQDISRFPRITVAFSCRSTYSRRLIRSSITEGTLTRVEHRGFAGHEYKAAEIYLGRRGIERPSAPLMAPEFSNPLFLKTCCNALVRLKETVFPKGLRGVTQIFNFFVDSLEEALVERMDIDPSDKIAGRAMKLVADEFATTGQSWMTRDRAKELLETIIPETNYSKSLLFHLIEEGALAADIHYEGSGDNQGIDIIRFAYERFSDHFIAQKLLNDHFDSNQPRRVFHPDAPLGKLVTGNLRWRFGDIIEALSIQVPERCGQELIDLLPPKMREDWWVRQAFINSIIWREPGACGPQTFEWLRRVGPTIGRYVIEETLLKVTTEPGHPFNADMLHRNLMRHPMPDRDAFWSIYLATHFYREDDGSEESIIRTLIKWAWEAEKSAVEDERIRLCAVALAWFLTTSHRIVRDQSTKALVGLLKDRPQIMRGLLTQFREVDDPYLSERLYAAAYGVALHCRDTAELSLLAQGVYELIFAGGDLPPHVLWRDYARGIIEAVVHQHCLPDIIDLDRVRPPYRSPWPLKISTEEELKAYDEKGSGQIRFSVIGQDFGTYVIGPEVSAWSETSLLAPRPITEQELFDSFFQRIEERNDQSQIAACKRMLKAIAALRKYAPFLLSELVTGDASPKDEKKAAIKILKTKRENAIQAFVNTLSPDEQETFLRYIKHHLCEGWRCNGPGTHAVMFDTNKAKRWICKRAYDFGWTIERFGDFERDYGHSADRSPPGIERMGKKYQWLALHEFLSRQSDNLYLLGRWGNEVSIQFQGPWQLGCRDIDPSLLVRHTQDKPFAKWPDPVWWRPFGVIYPDLTTGERVNWLWSKAGFPDIVNLLKVTQPKSGRKWFVLDSFSWWLEGRDEYSPNVPPWRDTWTRIQSCLVARSDGDKLKKFLSGKDRRDYHEFNADRADSKFFIGEYPWHPACAGMGADWVPASEGFRGLPVPILIPTLIYQCEIGTRDHSIEETINLKVPSPWLVKEMNLRLTDGHQLSYVDAAGRGVFFDPSVGEPGPSAALVDRDKFLALLEANNLTILWVIGGEKGLYGHHGDKFYGRQILGAVYYWDGSQIVGKRWITEERP